MSPPRLVQRQRQPVYGSGWNSPLTSSGSNVAPYFRARFFHDRHVDGLISRD